MKRAILATCIACLVGMALPATAHAANPSLYESLVVTTEFTPSSGVVVADGTGLYYHVLGMVFYEPFVYPADLWGEYPLFSDSLGDTPVATVHITLPDTSRYAFARVRVLTDAYTINPDGTDGPSRKDTAVYDLTVERGQTATVTDSGFWPLDYRLDRYVVTVGRPCGQQSVHELHRLRSERIFLFAP